MPVYPATPIAAIATIGLSIITGLYGLLTLAQRPERWRGPAFQYANTLDQRAWGIIFLALAVLTLVGIFVNRTLRNIGLYGTALVLAALAVGFLAAALHNPHVSFGASMWPAGVAFVLICLAQYGHRPGRVG